MCICLYGTEYAGRSGNTGYLQAGAVEALYRAQGEKCRAAGMDALFPEKISGDGNAVCIYDEAAKEDSGTISSV